MTNADGKLVDLAAWTAAHGGDPAAVTAAPATPEPRDLDAEETADLHRSQSYAAITRQAPYRFRDARATHPQVLDWVRHYLAADDGHCESLLLAGNIGAGKTHEAYGAIRAIADAGRPPVRWAAANDADFMSKLRSADIAERELMYQRYAETPILIYDDLGTDTRRDTSGPDFADKVLYRLFNHRHDEMLPTIITTNLGADGLHALLEPRTSSRLAGMTGDRRFEVTGPDRRRQGGGRP